MTKLKLVLLHVLIIVQILAPVLSRASSSSGLVSHLGDDDDDIIIDLSGYGDALFVKPDFETNGKRLAAYNPNTTLCNPEELGTYFQGDILLPSTRSLKNGLRYLSMRWPRAVVPYVIEDGFKEEEVAVILSAFKQYHNKTCVRFKKRTNENDYVSIQNIKYGCFSQMGRVGGKQVLNLLNPDCVSFGIVLHELMHSIGFLHEQSRHDRDKYIEVLWENIPKSEHKNFNVLPNVTHSFGVEYDYYSIMHYSLYAFALDKTQKTLKPRNPDVDENKIGLHEDFTESDLKKINAMYKCW